MDSNCIEISEVSRHCGRKGTILPSILSFLRTLLSLFDITLIRPLQEEGTVRSTPFGRLASVYYLEHMSIRFLTSTMKAKMNVEQVLNALTVCHFPYLKML